VRDLAGKTSWETLTATNNERRDGSVTSAWLKLVGDPSDGLFIFLGCYMPFAKNQICVEGLASILGTNT
jgi:hypothetical protein